MRGGVKAARNSAIGCACLLAVIEGVGIGMNRAMAGNTRPQNPPVLYPSRFPLGYENAYADHEVTRNRPRATRLEYHLHKS